MRRPTASVRRNVIFKTAAKLCRQYLKWYENASYKFEKNGERWVLQQLHGEAVRTVLDVGANEGQWATLATAQLPRENRGSAASTWAWRTTPGGSRSNTIPPRAPTPPSRTTRAPGPARRLTAPWSRATSF